MFVSDEWKDYELIDCGDGEKYERWGDVYLLRPDPQAIWSMEKPQRVDAHYHRSNAGGGEWEYFKKLPESWNIALGDLTFIVRPTGFKHTGLFPEQAVNWRFMRQLIENAGRSVEVLNLFGYTGGATAACLKAGAKVTHVDAAKSIVSWAKDNAAASGVRDVPARYIVDDCLKFVRREKRRGSRYQAILMDPPSYGRGPDGEMWKIEDCLFDLVGECADILADDPLFFIINSYTTGLAASVIENVLKLTVAQRFGGSIECGEVGLKATARDIALPCGCTGRWQA